MRRLIVLWLMTFCFGNLIATSISGISDYPDFCKLAASNDAVFKNFKTNPCYRDVLEHVTYYQGLEYLKIIKREYPFVLNYLEKCRENDLLGGPQIFSYGEEHGCFSPTTLRYMKVAGDLIYLFGDLSDKKIVEIGGGYGGQCKILSEISGFQQFTIFDLPEVCSLTEKYLSLLDIENVRCISNLETSDSEDYDLVISNYAFSEINRDEQLHYIDKVLNRSKMGYLTINFISDYWGIKGLDLKEILFLLKKYDRKLITIEERPSTAVKNIIVVWYEI